MNKQPQIGFRIDPELQKALRAKAEAEGLNVSQVLVELVNQYLAGGKFNQPISPLSNSATSPPPASYTGSPESLAQPNHRIDHLERLVISMFDTTTLTHRIASLEIRLIDVVKLLERCLTTVDLQQERGHAASQHDREQASFTDRAAVDSRLAEVEHQLANLFTRQQQMLDEQVQQLLTNVLAEVKLQVADQFAQQSEQIHDLQQMMASQKNESIAAMAEIESRFNAQLEQHSSQISELIQQVVEQQKQQNRSPDLNSSSENTTQETHSATPSSASRKKGKASEIPVTAKKISQGEPNSSQKSKKTKKTTGAQPESSPSSPSSTGASLQVEDGYVVIDGVRKRLLVPKEALEVARRNNPQFKGGTEHLRRLTVPEDRAALRQLGLEAIPQLKGGRGTRSNAWYYEL